MRRRPGHLPTITDNSHTADGRQIGRFFQGGAILQQNMGLLVLHLAGLRIHSIDRFFPTFQCHHHNGFSCPIELFDQLFQLRFQLLPVDSF